ncbi:integral component of membrane [Sergentomyia squamirostris]
MRILCVILVLVPTILASDYCLLRASFEVNNKITTECKVPANLSTSADMEAVANLCYAEDPVADLKILTANQTEFDSREICGKEGLKISGLITWITWKDFQSILRPLIAHLSEETVLIGRDSSRNICRVNLTSAMCHQDSTEEPIAVDHVLLERLPVAYELTDIVYAPWRNVTFLEQIVLTSVNLTNSHLETNFVEALVRYDFHKKINVTLFSSLTTGVPIIFHENSGTPLRYTVGEITRKMQSGIVSVVKRLPAKTSAVVRVIGTETLSVIHMTAKLTTIYARYDHGVDKIEQGDIKTTCIESGVMDVGAEETVKIQIDPPGSVPLPQSPLEPTKVPTQPPSLLPSTTRNPPISIFQPSGPIYPGFKTLSTVGVVVFFSVFIIAMTDVARKIIQDQRRKSNKIRH